MARQTISIYNRNGDVIVDPYAMTQKATNLRFSSGIPGGYKDCSFSVPASLRREIAIKNGYRMVIRNGMRTCWEGRIAERQRGLVDTQMLGFGLWEHLAQRRTTYTAPMGATAREIIRYVLRANSPLVGGHFNYLGDPGRDLGGMAWSRASLQRIILDLQAALDAQDVPNKWYFAVWDSTETEETGSYYEAVAGSPDDAHDSSDNVYNSYLDMAMKFGNDGDRTWSTGLRFTGVQIPRYTAIRYATLYVYGALTSQVDAVHTLVYGDESGNSLSFTDVWPHSRLTTYSYTEWDPPQLEQWTWYTIDVTQQVQEIVDLPGWQTGNAMSMLIRDNGSTNVGVIEAFDMGGGTQAKLLIGWGRPEGGTMRFPPIYAMKPPLIRENVDYLLFLGDIAEGFNVTESLENLFNAVTAKYANSLYTLAAEDDASIAAYDRRENDPESLDAGSGASEIAAQTLRDTFLSEHKLPTWKTSNIVVSRLRDRYGNIVLPEYVRPGSLVRIVDLPTFDLDRDNIFWVTQTEYDAEQDQLTLWPDVPETAGTMLGQSTEDIILGPYFEFGIIRDFDKTTYLAEVEVADAIYVDVPVAHNIGFWLPETNKACLVSFRTIDRKAENAVVLSVFSGLPIDDPHFRPDVGHRHDGEWQQGPILI